MEILDSPWKMRRERWKGLNKWLSRKKQQRLCSSAQKQHWAKMIFHLHRKPRKDKHLQSGFSELSTTSSSLCVDFTPQSSTLFGRTRSGLPSPLGRWTRSGTADMTSGCWRESWCILDSGCPGDDPSVFIFLSAEKKPSAISQQAQPELGKQQNRVCWKLM